LFHILCYGSFTRSHRPLLTPRGMRRMEQRGLVTPKERKVLIGAQVSATQRFNVVLMWILRTIIDGRKAGYVEGGLGLEPQIIGKVQEIRAQANSMEAELRGRMPFAYAHVVQVLVDAVLWMYPVGAFTSGISLQIGLMGTFALTICYQGLFDLSKRFLDPYHNENFWSGDDALIVDTLLAETNAGSVRWVYGLEEMPIPYRSLKDANLGEFILPDEGYSKKDAQERTAQEEKLKEEEVALGRMTQEEVARKAAEIMGAVEEEYEETQRILNAPPGSDFVPGLDDDGESLAYFTPMSNSTETAGALETPTEVEVDPVEWFEKYLDATENEYQTSKNSTEQPEEGSFQ